MKQTIRFNTFETNSSSTHSMIIIPDKYYKDFEDGKLTLEQVYEYGKQVGEPKQTSGKQELYEAIVALYAK